MRLDSPLGAGSRSPEGALHTPAFCWGVQATPSSRGDTRIPPFVPGLSNKAMAGAARGPMGVTGSQEPVHGHCAHWGGVRSERGVSSGCFPSDNSDMKRSSLYSGPRLLCYI